MGDTSICDRIGNYFSELGKWRVWQNIILGQILSLILCTSNILSHCITTGSSQVAPTSQSFPHYMFLCAIYTSWLAFRRGDKGLITIIKVRGWRHLLLCIIDVQANTLMSTAHQFTNIRSVQLLGCVAIPVALALTCLVLGVRYRMVHIFAISVCLIGVGCLVWANIEDTKVDGKNQLIGDMLSLGGAVLFAIVTVLQELCIRHTDAVEYLGLLGLFGSIVSGMQMLILEKQTLLAASWRNSSALLSSFSASKFIFCTLSSIFLLNMGTTALHLSLLSGNFYTLIVGIFFFEFKFHGMYFLSYTLSMTGVYIYCSKKTPSVAHNMSSNANNTNRSECQNREHIVSVSPGHGNEMVAAFDTLTSNETFGLTHSANTTFTSFYGSHEIINPHFTTTTT